MISGLEPHAHAKLELSFPANEFNNTTVSDLWRRFHQEHNNRFGFCIPGEMIETVHLKVVAVSVQKKPEMRPLPYQVGSAEPTGKRRVRFEEGWAEVAVYDRSSFGQGCRITGPAIIEEAASATVLCANQEMAVDPFGNLLITASF